MKKIQLKDFNMNGYINFVFGDIDNQDISEKDYDEFLEKERKRIRQVKDLLNKLLNKNNIYVDLPFSELKAEEQYKLIEFILGHGKREIVSNMGKTDIDRDYYSFILSDEEEERFTKKNYG